MNFLFNGSKSNHLTVELVTVIVKTFLFVTNATRNEQVFVIHQMFMEHALVSVANSRIVHYSSAMVKLLTPLIV